MKIQTQLFIEYTHIDSLIYEKIYDYRAINSKEDIVQVYLDLHKETYSRMASKSYYIEGVTLEGDFKFYTQNYIEYNGIVYWDKVTSPCSIPVYYPDAINEYYNIINRAVHLLPKLRKAEYKRQEEEYALYKILHEKYKHRR